MPAESKKIIVLDIAIPPFRDNRVLNAGFANKFPGASVLPRLREVAADSGWDMMTGDVFLKKRHSFQRAVCLSNEATPELARILKRGVEPRVLVSGESPNVAWAFYHNLPRLSKEFRHACLFKGALNRVHPGTRFYVHYWPMPNVRPTVDVAFADRRLIAMVTAFKEQFGFNRKSIISRIIAPMRWAKILYYQAIDSHARFPDLYKTRWDAVHNFASKGEFFLYGRDWDVARTYVKKIRNLAFANTPRTCDNKIDTLGSFRFTLVLENCIFPGYVTEKIFDAMLAGTVPVYLGAPDIEDFVPCDCFVDFRNHQGFDDLWEDISSWSEERWQNSIKNINRFLDSEKYAPFKEENVAQKLFEWLTG